MVHSPGFLALVGDAKTCVREIDVAQYVLLQKSGEAHVLVDTREESEWNAGHVTGAVHLSKGIIERDIEAKIPAKDTKLVLYCGGGYRSALAADNLQKMGYTNVLSLDGGWKGLLQSDEVRKTLP
ncbi:MAG: rhodanese-like domain-containing protein [Acidobacteria bacterium]|nr:rhodanese-like domain-containing protein [Acidobacteriota bacterium]